MTIKPRLHARIIKVINVLVGGKFMNFKKKGLIITTSIAFTNKLNKGFFDIGEITWMKCSNLEFELGRA